MDTKAAGGRVSAQGSGAVGGVWPTGSCPLVAVGQVRLDRESGYTYRVADRIELAGLDDWRVVWEYGKSQAFLAETLADDPLAEPWTDPAPTPDAIAAAEARGYARGREEERADVVAHLNMTTVTGVDDPIALRDELAELFVRAEHLGAAKGGEGR